MFVLLLHYFILREQVDISMSKLTVFSLTGECQYLKGYSVRVKNKDLLLWCGHLEIRIASEAVMRFYDFALVTCLLVMVRGKYCALHRSPTRSQVE